MTSSYSTPMLLAPHQTPAFLQHVDRHMSESGQNGVPVFHPIDSLPRRDIAQNRERLRARWAIPVEQPLWERVWAIWYGDEIVGHLELRGGELKTEQHRANLGIGIEQRAARIGLGTRLVYEAVTWAQKNTEIDYIDLGVLAENLPSIQFFQRLGFKETARFEDRYRVYGRPLANILMEIKIGDL